jgi:hypothetical protein
MPSTVTKEELQERAQLVRVHEANCGIEHPTENDLNFRLAIMKKLAQAFSLAELRKLEITGPARLGSQPQKPK